MVLNWIGMPLSSLFLLSLLDLGWWVYLLMFNAVILSIHNTCGLFNDYLSNSNYSATSLV
jgi:hypothetical protein